MQLPIIISLGPSNCSNHFRNKIISTHNFQSIKMVGSILSVNMSFSEKMWAFAELSTITYDPSESNPTCSEFSSLEESMWHILSFEIVQKIKGLFLVWPLKSLFLALQLILLEFGFSLLFLNFCLAKSDVGTLSQFSLTFSILDSL